MLKYYFNSKLDIEIMFLKLLQEDIQFFFRTYEASDPTEFVIYEFVVDENDKDYIDSVCTILKLKQL